MHNYHHTGEGVNSSPCSDIYPGAIGGSEPETQAVSNELIRLGPSLLALVTLHSYGNLWMFSWGNTIDHEGVTCERTDDWEELVKEIKIILK